jgi:ATP-dependent RNA circularization protein (DNA/RNA ligase family)
MMTALFAALLDEKDNTLGRAFIWPMILLIASIKAVRSVYLETKAEMKDWKTVKKKE